MVGETVREAARRFGDRPAFVGDDGRSISYAQLDLVSDRVAVDLASQGVGPGDVVALLLPAVPEFPVAYAAAAKLGAITAGVSPRLTAPERAALLDLTQPAVVIDDPSHLEIETVSGVRPQKLSQFREDVALVFTSGTTGQPKAALFGARQLQAITAVELGEAWGSGGAMLAAGAPGQLEFMTKLPGCLRRGMTQFMSRRWSAGEALRLTAQQRMTVVSGSPSQIALMLRSPDFDRHDLASVQAVVMSGSPATPALVREARERFGAVVITRYSCTEAGMGLGTSHSDPPEDAEQTVGRPLAGVALALVDEEEVPLDPGEVGAVCLRSPAVMTGYWRDPTATAAAFTADEYVRTGDMGWMDERGRLHLAGRNVEMYVHDGLDVYPVEVEAVLAECPTVGAVAVVPRQDAAMGECGVAVVVPRPGAVAPTLADLRDHAVGRLAQHKLPEDLLIVDELPLTAMDKVDRRALAALVAPRLR